MYPVKILADKVLNLTDARYFAARGVDFICLNDDTSPEIITAPEIAAIAGWIDGPELLLHYISDTYQAGLVNQVTVSGYLFNGQSSINEIDTAGVEHRFLIYDLHNFEQFLTQGLSGTDIVLGYDYLILRLRNTGKSLDALLQDGALPILQSICAAASVFIDAELSPASLSKVIEEIRPEGLILYGGLEDQVGVRDYDHLDEIFDALETIDV